MKLIVSGMLQPMSTERYYVCDVPEQNVTDMIKKLKKHVTVYPFETEHHPFSLLIPVNSIHTIYPFVDVVYNERVPNPLELEERELKEELLAIQNRLL